MEIISPKSQKIANKFYPKPIIKPIMIFTKLPIKNKDYQSIHYGSHDPTNHDP